MPEWPNTFGISLKPNTDKDFIIYLPGPGFWSVKKEPFHFGKYYHFEKIAGPKIYLPGNKWRKILSVKWRPDLVQSEDRIIMAFLFRL
jgi:hypothetical protein